MKRFLSSARLWVGALAVALALGAVNVQVKAQTTTRTDVNAPVVPPRQYTEQTKHFIRTTLAYNMCVQSSNACVVKLLPGALPYNAWVTGVTVVTYTAFNSTTSDVVTLGISSANANELVSSGVSMHATGVAAATLVSNIQAVTGGGAMQTGGDGGFELWAKWTAGAGNTATAGLASIIVEYIPANDGSCVMPPLGSTSPGC